MPKCERCHVEFKELVELVIDDYNIDEEWRGYKLQVCQACYDEEEG